MYDRLPNNFKKEEFIRTYLFEFYTSPLKQYFFSNFMVSFYFNNIEIFLDKVNKTGNSEIVEDVSLFSVIMNDLNTKRLLKVPSLSELHKVGLSINKTINKMTTQLGDEVLKFIKDNSNNE